MLALVACGNIEALGLADFLYMPYSINSYSKFIKQFLVLWNERVCLLLLLGQDALSYSLFINRLKFTHFLPIIGFV